jgi:glutamate N-acetyltransferase / amino-acid N-acetyltransferase
VTLTGIAKGSGMIRPDMATMLAFLATDAAIPAADLQNMLGEAVEGSFNCITVDGDTSTNDACVLVATAASGARLASDEDRRLFTAALQAVCDHLAQAIVRDGEGATKFIALHVTGARTAGEARQVADAVAHSPLVKTALFASDPNWGRILAAVGRAGVADLDVSGVRIEIGDVLIVEQGARAAGYTEEAGKRVMAEAEIPIRIQLGRGSAEARVYTCDFSYDYVRINADYRS